MSRDHLERAVTLRTPRPPQPLIDRQLTVLHAHGWWFRAWYPLTPSPARPPAEPTPRWECRISNGTSEQWGVGGEAMTALLIAMRKAGLR